MRKKEGKKKYPYHARHHGILHVHPAIIALLLLLSPHHAAADGIPIVRPAKRAVMYRQEKKLEKLMMCSRSGG